MTRQDWLDVVIGLVRSATAYIHDTESGSESEFSPAARDFLHESRMTVARFDTFLRTLLPLAYELLMGKELDLPDVPDDINDSDESLMRFAVEIGALFERLAPLPDQEVSTTKEKS